MGMIIEASVSKEGETKAPLIPNGKSSNELNDLSLSSDIAVAVGTNGDKHEAPVSLQKVYKIFCTRRKLADCATLVEDRWRELLDFAELKRSSVSFFATEKPESPISRWSRARTRASKVGKGLSKNDKAQKLAMQHWLEAIDPQHRYGHNLHFYYAKWLQSKSREPFFYWLDVGEGKEVTVEKCTRFKLQKQCIKYLGPMERKEYEVIIVDGKFFYKEMGDLLHTTFDAKSIFVLSTSKTLYAGKKVKGLFQHSSFLAGGATIAAGRLVVENGILKAVWPHSGHYRPTEKNFQDFILFLKENNVDLTDVKLSFIDEDIPNEQTISNHRRSYSEDLMNVIDNEEFDDENLTQGNNESTEEENAFALKQSKNSMQNPTEKKLSNLVIPEPDEFLSRLKNEDWATRSNSGNALAGSPVADDNETLEEAYIAEHKCTTSVQNFSDEEQKAKVGTSCEEPILQRIKSKKITNLYPSELRLVGPERVNFFPTSAGHCKLYGWSLIHSIFRHFSGQMDSNEDSTELEDDTQWSSPLQGKLSVTDCCRNVVHKLFCVNRKDSKGKILLILLSSIRKNRILLYNDPCVFHQCICCRQANWFSLMRDEDLYLLPSLTRQRLWQASNLVLSSQLRESYQLSIDEKQNQSIIHSHRLES